MISNDEDIDRDVNTRLAKAATVFRSLDNVWKTSSLELSTKLKLYAAMVMSTAIHTSDWSYM